MKYPDWYQKNAKLCAYIEELAAKDNFAILLTGKPGCGKTAIAEIVFDHIYAMYKNDSRFSYVAISADKMYGNYMAAMNQSGSERTAAIEKAERYLMYDLVLLDDLGCEISSDASASYFARVFSMQYEAWKDGKRNRVIITTNLNIEGIASVYGSRVMDRIAEFYHVITLTNDSWRMKNLKQVRF
jgi:DNA replication protein DnaC